MNNCLCPICKEGIKKDAKVCIHCGHCVKGNAIKKFVYNWHSRLNLGLAIIALIISILF